MPLLLVLLLLVGCVAHRIDAAIDDYQAIADRIHLGDEKEKVLALLAPIQTQLNPIERKVPESFLKEGATVEIYYARSGRISDDLTTDDEFMPYVFTNGKLTAIGWTTLGGPKTHGQAGGSGPVVMPMPMPKSSISCSTVGNITRCY